MFEKTVDINGKKVKFKSSAAIPRLYRIMFKRDIFSDISKLESSYSDSNEENSSLKVEDLTIFENVAYLMAKHADPSIPDTIEEWLEEFEMFSIYQILPEILELWGSNLETSVQAKKRVPAPSGK